MTQMLLNGALHRSANSNIRLPDYGRDKLLTGVVHLGVGAFSRAHQLVYFDDLLSAGDCRWGTVGASLRSAEVSDRLRPQDFFYTIVEKGSSVKPRVIGALADVIVANQSGKKLLAQMASPNVYIVTLTVTEKGYSSPEHERLEQPPSAAGFIGAALQLRRHAGLKPFTVISCDNLSENGTRLQTIVQQLTDQSTAEWIEKNGAFPNSMVDRIVPATTQSDIDDFAKAYGYVDRALVCTEPYKQWVIEDRFAGERPDFESVGVDIVADVRPWETAKLQMLNGAHSGLAYLGALAGHEFVHQCVSQRDFRRFVELLWDETATTLPGGGPDITPYRHALMARFDNATLPHKTRQIAIDGSQKLPQRLVAPLRARLAAGLETNALSLAIAGWMRWQMGRDEQGQIFAVDDPLAAKTANMLASANDPQSIVGALLSLHQVFGDDLRSNMAFVAQLEHWLKCLLDKGASDTLANLR